jgi:hypothetical protein
MLIVAGAANPKQVAMATLIIPLVVAVRHRIARHPLQGAFLAEIFLWGFLLRAFLGLIIYHFDLWEFYGGDSTTYDSVGWDLAEVWHGRSSGYMYLFNMLASSNPGILYVTAAFYYVFGHYLLLLQFVLSAIGAATAVLVVKIADTLFEDREVSILAGLLVAFFPSIVMWTCQPMKEALVLFLLCLTVYSMQQIVIRLRLRYALYISAALVAMLYVRFYITYVMLVTLAAALITPYRSFSGVRLIRQLAAVGLTMASVAYLVDARDILTTFQEHTRLEMIQVGRLDQAQSAKSGFAVEADVSTVEGAQGHFLTGFLHVMFGPFPWKIGNLRQAMALPEGLFWWMMVPAFLRGLWLALRHRLAESWFILVLTIGIVVPYSISQGNVGTAYRQRVQVLIFLFIFVAWGYVWKKRQRLARALARRGGVIPVEAERLRNDRDALGVMTAALRHRGLVGRRSSAIRRPVDPAQEGNA